MCRYLTRSLTSLSCCDLEDHWTTPGALGSNTRWPENPADSRKKPRIYILALCFVMFCESCTLWPWPSWSAVPWCSTLKYVKMSSRYAVLYQLKHNSAPGMHPQGGPVIPVSLRNMVGWVLPCATAATAATGTAGRSAALAGRHMLWHVGQRTQNFTNFSSSQIKSVWSSKFWAWLSASIYINL